MLDIASAGPFFGIARIAMASKIEEITVTFNWEKHRFRNDSGDVIIGDATLVNGSSSASDERISIKGKSECNSKELQRDQTYTLYGRWGKYKNKRTLDETDQFAFDSFVQSIPASRRGVIAYIRNFGRGHRIGPVTAVRIWEEYLTDAIRMIREEPDTVAARFKLPFESMGKVSAAMIREQATEKAFLAVIALLDGQGFSKKLPGDAIELWGNVAAEMIAKNPYILMTHLGVGFKKADALWLGLGKNPGALRRQSYCAWYTLKSNNDGHTWHPISTVIDGLNDAIGGADVRLMCAIKFCIRIGRVLGPRTIGALAVKRINDFGLIVETGGELYAAVAMKAQQEETICDIVVDANSWDRSTIWPSDMTVLRTYDARITDEQLAELEKATRGQIGILGGGPGTGKTFSAALLIRWMVDKYGANAVIAGAPTGKAAVRLTELLQEYGVPIKAKTWHSHLQFPIAKDQDFLFCKGNPLRAKILIGDESSMLDGHMMSCVFAARAPGAHVLLIGDINQLPPVGSGAPLRDLIEACVPYGQLTKIMRNSGGIVEACDAIRQDLPWGEGDNLKIIKANSPSDQLEKCIEAIDASGYGIWDCQVLIALNEKGDLSRALVNKRMQGVFNDNPEIDRSEFRLGDKVVNTENGWFPKAKNADRERFGMQLDRPFLRPLKELARSDTRPSTSSLNDYVANGEIGSVFSCKPNRLLIRLWGPDRLIVVIHGNATEKSTGCSFQLGYAFTPHKAQGSEWKFGVVLIDEWRSARMVCDRSWVYTAISRFKKKCVLIGKKKTADQFCSRNVMAVRKTFLREMISQTEISRGLEGM